MPVPPPSAVPAPAPTAAPVPGPTPAPTLSPTTGDTATVRVSLEVTASGPPTPGDEAALKAAVANATGVEPSAVRDLVISYTNTSRRLLVASPGASPGAPSAAIAAAGSSRRRRLTTYTWAVSFNVVADVSDAGAASPAAFASAIAGTLSGGAFASTLLATLPTSTTAMAFNAAFVSTQPPTSAPLAPSPMPSTEPEDDVGGGSADSASGGSELLMLLVVPVVMAFGYMMHKKFDKKAVKVKVGPAPKKVDASLSPFRFQFEEDEETKSCESCEAPSPAPSPPRAAALSPLALSHRVHPAQPLEHRGMVSLDAPETESTAAAMAARGERAAALRGGSGLWSGGGRSRRVAPASHVSALYRRTPAPVEAAGPKEADDGEEEEEEEEAAAAAAAVTRRLREEAAAALAARRSPLSVPRSHEHLVASRGLHPRAREVLLAPVRAKGAGASRRREEEAAQRQQPPPPQLLQEPLADQRWRERQEPLESSWEEEPDELVVTAARPHDSAETDRALAALADDLFALDAAVAAGAAAGAAAEGDSAQGDSPRSMAPVPSRRAPLSSSTKAVSVVPVVSERGVDVVQESNLGAMLYSRLQERTAHEASPPRAAFYRRPPAPTAPSPRASERSSSRSPEGASSRASGRRGGRSASQRAVVPVVSERGVVVVQESALGAVLRSRRLGEGGEGRPASPTPAFAPSQPRGDPPDQAEGALRLVEIEDDSSCARFADSDEEGFSQRF